MFPSWTYEDVVPTVLNLQWSLGARGVQRQAKPTKVVPLLLPGQRGDRGEMVITRGFSWVQKGPKMLSTVYRELKSIRKVAWLEIS